MVSCSPNWVKIFASSDMLMVPSPATPLCEVNALKASVTSCRQRSFSECLCMTSRNVAKSIPCSDRIQTSRYCTHLRFERPRWKLGITFVLVQLVVVIQLHDRRTESQRTHYGRKYFDAGNVSVSREQWKAIAKLWNILNANQQPNEQNNHLRVSIDFYRTATIEF